MSERHEKHLVNVLGGRMTKGSGSTFADQGDGKQDYRSGQYVFCWDGKSTMAKSISVSIDMWEKIEEQAHWARPAIPLRFYSDRRGINTLDLVVCSLTDFADMQTAANEITQLREENDELRRRMEA
jgi:hypothetical protein